MREIKFRVWDEQFKRMSKKPEQIRLNIANGNVHGSRSGGNVETWKLMQYTGLKDKNGVEIYEGDVIEFSSHWDKHVCAVSFNKCKFGFGREIKGELGINDDCDLVSFMSGSGCNGYTVIGNIHQHPELLEQNDD